MNNIITIAICYPIICLIAFLLHEYFHIKHAGFKATGTIYVGETGFTASCNDVWNNTLFFMSGGVLSSIVLFAMCFFITNPTLLFCFWSNAWLQLIYGIYEGINMSNVKDRWYVYAAVILITSLIWWWNIV